MLMGVGYDTVSYGPQNLYSSYSSLSLVVPWQFLVGKALYNVVMAEGPRRGGQMGAADRGPHHAHAPEERWPTWRQLS